MSRSALKGLQAAAGAAGGGGATYVDDVFSTFLYTGNVSGFRVQNNIKLADGAENNTFLQITGDGSISDVSPFGHTLTASSTATTSTSVKKFGSASLDLSYDANTYPTVSAPLDTAPRGNEDFTVEGWIYHSDATGSNRCIYTTGGALQIYMNNRNIIVYCSTSSSGSPYFINGAGGNANSVSNNTWAHFAFVRHGNVFTMYVNGVGVTAATHTVPIGLPLRSLIGGYTTSSYGFTAGGGNGYIDDFRITRGRAVYTANFTPPSSAHSLDTQVTGEGGLVWIKERDVSQNHVLTDTARGATKTLVSNANSAQATDTSHLTAFNSDGFTVANGNEVNHNNKDFVSWTFRKQPGFFDVVTYTGNGQSNRAISHNLDSKPGLVIIKDYGQSAGWMVGAGFTSTQYYRLALESSGAASGGGLANYDNYLSAEPTTTTFSVGNEGLGNANGQAYVAYLFANDDQRFGEDSDEAAIKVGTYTGNGSSTGPTINLGFEPQWLLLKKVTGSSEAWIMHDNMRGIVTGGNDPQLQADSSSTEWVGSTNIELTATGFKLTSSSAQYNENNQTYIYMAIARPNKPASELTTTDLFKPSIYTGDGGSGLLAIDAPASPQAWDLAFFKSRQLNGRDWHVVTRLINSHYEMENKGNAPKSLHFNTADAEADVYSFSSTGRDILVNQDGYGNLSVNGENYGAWRFSRAPGFFDVVAYTGNQTARQIAHNLGAVPEMMWVKCRSQTRNWAVYAAPQGNTKVGQLNGGGAFTADTSSWNNTSPTSTHFTVGDGATTNFNPEPMIAYLFASVPGVSKIGTYTGTGNDINVDCGFTNGARFVMIKRTDSTADWYIWDTARGIVAGNDGYLRLNLSNDEETNYDYIDPLSSGFTVTAAAPSDLNSGSGGTFLFYAIA